MFTEPPIYQAPFSPKFKLLLLAVATAALPPVVLDVTVVVAVVVVLKTAPAVAMVTIPLASAPSLMVPVAEIEPPVASRAIKPPFVVILPAI